MSSQSSVHAEQAWDGDAHVSPWAVWKSDDVQLEFAAAAPAAAAQTPTKTKTHDPYAVSPAPPSPLAPAWSPPSAPMALADAVHAPAPAWRNADLHAKWDAFAPHCGGGGGAPPSAGMAMRAAPVECHRPPQQTRAPVAAQAPPKRWPSNRVPPPTTVSHNAWPRSHQRQRRHHNPMPNGLAEKSSWASWNDQPRVTVP